MKLVAALIGIALVGAVGYFDLTKSWGAHPFWSFKVTTIGAPIGAVLFLLFRMRFSAMVSLVSWSMVGIAAFLAAHYGKLEFAASYAENATAGKFWYFGWIGASAAAAAAIASLIDLVSRKKAD